MSTTRFMFSTLTAAATLSLAHAAMAATSTTQMNISVATPASPTYMTPLTLNVPQFDPAAGTLTGVSIAFNVTSHLGLYVSDSFTYSFANGQLVQNFQPGVPYSINLSTIGLNLQGPTATNFPALPSTGTTIASQGIPLTINPYTGTSPTDTSARVLVDTFSAALAGTYNVPAASVSQLVGTSSLPVSFSVGDTVGQISSGGGTPGFGVGDVLGTATVTYTFTPSAVPEPASLSVIGLGSAMLLRRRRSV